ncbi:MAG: DUF126 domain-containing protein [Sulfolobales archaeon]
MSENKVILKGRSIVEGFARGKTLVVDDYISPLGEIDRETGYLKKRGYPEVSLSGRVLFFRGSRGSTVGPYVLYDLSRRNKAPAAMIVSKADQIVIIGGVLGNIVVIELQDWSDVQKVPNDACAEVRAERDLAEVIVYV